jgi:hypothetical protein
MIEKGQITAAEGMELLEALNTTKGTEAVQLEVPVTTAKHNYKFLRIRVTSDNKALNVNVNVPIRLLTTVGELADKMLTVIPADARREMEAKGVDITKIDFAKIIEEVINGTLDDPNIVEVEAWDESHNGMIKVRIYVE